jgi:hypothetical protein
MKIRGQILEFAPQSKKKYWKLLVNELDLHQKAVNFATPFATLPLR